MHNPYETALSREIEANREPRIELSPWGVQNIVYGLLEDHLLQNSPSSLGYNFTQKFDKDSNKSDIHLDVNFNWKTSNIQKRPAVFVQRGDLSFPPGVSVMGQNVSANTRDSEYTKFQIATMPVQVVCIGTNIGFTEMFADYIKFPLTYFRQQIQEDFCFRQFKVTDIKKPEIYVEGPDHFAILINVSTSFDLGWTVKAADLRLKKVSFGIFANAHEKMLVQ